MTIDAAAEGRTFERAGERTGGRTFDRTFYAPSGVSEFLLLEDDFKILLESGDKLLKEG